MKPRKATYLAHRWLGLLVSVQLLAWSTGGFLFSVLELDMVRGEQDIGAPPLAPLDPSAVEGAADAVSATLIESEEDAASIALLDRGLGPFWEVRDAHGALLSRVGPDGAPAPTLLTPEQAADLAQRDFAHDATVRDVRLIETDPPVEYRSGVLPAYAVSLNHARRPHIYLDARTGEVTARRNRPWRIFDFFWMLHTMDYAGRDDFNHPLLTGFSALAIVTAASGLTLWGWRALPRRRGRGNR